MSRKTKAIVGVLCLVVVATVAVIASAASPVHKAAKGFWIDAKHADRILEADKNSTSVNVLNEGVTQGMWITSTHGLVAAVHKTNHHAVPFVCLYEGSSAESSQHSFPHGLRFDDDGSVLLQIAGDSIDSVRIVKMSYVQELVKADEARRRSKHNPAK